MRSPSESSTVCFAIHAEADPSVMPRVLEQFAKRGLVPSQWHSSAGHPRAPELVIDIQVSDLAPGIAERIAESLRRIVRVNAVLTGAKG